MGLLNAETRFCLRSIPTAKRRRTARGLDEIRSSANEPQEEGEHRGDPRSTAFMSAGRRDGRYGASMRRRRAAGRRAVLRTLGRREAPAETTIGQTLTVEAS